MPLVLPDPPEGGWRLIGSHVPYLLEMGGPRGRLRATSTPWTVAMPHPIYDFTFDDFREVVAEKGKEPDGWQYLILRHDSIVASGEIGKRKHEPNLIFTVLRNALHAERTCDALRTAESLAEVRHNQYMLGIVRKVELWFRAVWLRPCDGGQDLFVPIEPVHPDLRDRKKCTEDELRKVLRARLNALRDARGG